MTLRDFDLMTDENISPEVTAMLRKEGLDVFSVEESEFVGSTDRQLIRLAYAAKRVILTHDSDFGMLAIRDGEPYSVSFICDRVMCRQFIRLPVWPLTQ